MDDEPTTQELRLSQFRREASERQGAAEADTEAETAQHDRRADKAAYLERKLAERAEAERRGVEGESEG